jgi:hypothetical protein
MPTKWVFPQATLVNAMPYASSGVGITRFVVGDKEMLGSFSSLASPPNTTLLVRPHVKTYPLAVTAALTSPEAVICVISSSWSAEISLGTLRDWTSSPSPSYPWFPAPQEKTIFLFWALLISNSNYPTLKPQVKGRCWCNLAYSCSKLHRVLLLDSWAP